jgi:hypothetical protein
MKFFFLIFITFLSAGSASAQFSTNVYWTEQTSMDLNDVIYYNPSQNLNWSNFKGTPGPPGPVAAITSSGFGYKANMKNTGSKGEVNVMVYCYFSKSKSWVRPGKTTSYILNHEQHHFDVSYLAAGIFIEKVKKAGLTMANCNTLLPRIYRECCDFMNKMQDDYDGQTKNGQLTDEQARWNVYFNARIPLVIK